jgi:hypothetical protein
MLEVGIICVILFALGYWATLFMMGRREDVLHGEFVEGERQMIPVPEPPPMPFPGTKPASRPVMGPVVSAKRAPLSVAESIAKAEASAAAKQPVIVMKTAGPDLQSLLASLKQELKNAAQI